MQENSQHNKSSGMERRLTLRLLNYWEDIKGDKFLPHENDIDPDQLSDLWEYCFVIQVRDLDKSDYNYTYLGTAIREAYTAGIDNEDPDIASPNANKLTLKYQHVITTVQPVLEEGEFNNMRGQIIKYRQCLLPLGTDRTVEAIFGGMRFKIF